MDVFAGDKGGGGGAGECCFQTMQTPRQNVTPTNLKRKKERKKKRVSNGGIYFGCILFVISDANSGKHPQHIVSHKKSSLLPNQCGFISRHRIDRLFIT